MGLERRWKWDSSCRSKSVRHTYVLAQVNDYAYVHCTHVILCSASDVRVKDDGECDNVVLTCPGHGLRLWTCLPVAKYLSYFVLSCQICTALAISYKCDLVQSP